MKTLIQKRKFITQIDFAILKLKKSCDLIDREHFCVYFMKEIFPKHAVFAES